MKSSQSPNVKRLTRTFQGRELLGQEVYHEIVVEKEMFKVEYPGNTSSWASAVCLHNKLRKV